MSERSENVQGSTDANDPFKMLTEMRDRLVFPANIGDGSTFGITKRELFAAMAMQGIFAHGYTMPNESAEAALYAVRAADCLLKELAK